MKVRFQRLMGSAVLSAAGQPSPPRGERNITDRDPPYANYASSSNNFIGGYDIAYGDARGRFVYGRVAYTFK